MNDRQGGDCSRGREYFGGQRRYIGMRHIPPPAPLWPLQTPKLLFRNHLSKPGGISIGQSNRFFPLLHTQKDVPKADNVVVMTDSIMKFLELQFSITGHSGECNLALLIDTINNSASLNALSATESHRLLIAVNALDHARAYDEYVTFEGFLSRLPFLRRDRILSTVPSKSRYSLANQEKKEYEQFLRRLGDEDSQMTLSELSQKPSGHFFQPRPPLPAGTSHTTQSTHIPPHRPSTFTHTSASLRAPFGSIHSSHTEDTIDMSSLIHEVRRSWSDRFHPRASLVAASYTRRSEQTQQTDSNSSSVPGEEVLDRIDKLMAHKALRMSLPGSGRRSGVDVDSDTDSDMDESDMEVESEGEEEGGTQWMQALLAARRRPLTAAQEESVNHAMAPPHDEAVVVEKYKIEMSRRKISCLLPRKYTL